MPLSCTVIVVTLNRPECVRRCLGCLVNQVPPPEQIIVVDASADDLTCRVVQDFPNVLYLRNENGFGRMTASRNIGLKRATGEIIAFLDDDAFAHPGWLASLKSTYTDDTVGAVGAVGGRALNNQPDEASVGMTEIGRFRPNGDLAGNFAADPGRVIEVDHVMGCNMSFRRQVVARLGGFREDYPGISGVREDSDMCMRVKRLGYRILFSPDACVDHISAPQATGSRFDSRYAYYLQRNHLCLLVRNFGLAAPAFWSYVTYSAYQPIGEFWRRVVGAFVRFAAVNLGTAAGLLAGLALILKTGRDPVRNDADAQSIRAALDGTTLDRTAREGDPGRLPTTSAGSDTCSSSPL